MKIHLDEVNSMPLRKLKMSFNEELDIEGIAKPVLGELLISSSVGGVTVTGRLKTLLKLNCHVCLRPYFQTLNIEVDEQFAASPSEIGSLPKDRELTKKDFYEQLPADGILDITDIVYQAVTLASPVFCRCGSECPGPPRSEKASLAGNSADPGEPGAAEDRIDPRWENLKTLFSKDDTVENS